MLLLRRGLQFASLRVWDTKEWKPACAPLNAHSSTVTQIEFSHSNHQTTPLLIRYETNPSPPLQPNTSDDEYLVAVSKDRHLSLFRRKPLPSPAPLTPTGAVATVHFVCVSYVAAHSRVVWAVSWSGDDSLIVSGSRDRSVKCWRRATDPLERSELQHKKKKKLEKKTGDSAKTGAAASSKKQFQDYEGAEPEFDAEEPVPGAASGAGAGAAAGYSPAMSAIVQAPEENWLQDSLVVKCDRPVTAVACVPNTQKA